MKIVYLDQNHWIELARAVHGRSGRADATLALALVRSAKATGEACFPLSLAHYIETHKQRDAGRRSRLAQVMMELSGGSTIAPPHVVLRHEIEVALQAVFPGRLRPSTFNFLGRGLSHAADADFDFRIDWPLEAAQIPTAVRSRIEAVAQEDFARSILAGVLPTGQSALLGPATDLSSERGFNTGMNRWRSEMSQLEDSELDRRIYAITLSDIFDDLKIVLDQHGINIVEFERLGESGWCKFLDELPSRRADMHLRRQWTQNLGLRAKESDLNDWSYIGCAVSHCDVVVTDKQMADLLTRRFQPRAIVIGRITGLKATIEKLSRSLAD